MATKASFDRERHAARPGAGRDAEAGWVDLPVHIVTGPEEYLFGEEKALLEVIEGNEPLPRWLPPYLHGLFATVPQMGWDVRNADPAWRLAEDGANPTLVNNVETLSNVPTSGPRCRSGSARSAPSSRPERCAARSWAT